MWCREEEKVLYVSLTYSRRRLVWDDADAASFASRPVLVVAAFGWGEQVFLLLLALELHFSSWTLQRKKTAVAHCTVVHATVCTYIQ